MTVVIRIVVGALLIAHGLVHLLYEADDVPEFSIDDSWLIPDSPHRAVALGLMWATAAIFVLLGLAVWGVPGLATVRAPLAVTGAALSLLLLVAFWSWSLVFGVAIDVALIAVAVSRPHWADRIVA